jgi:peptide/nickel transport system permease protein
MKRSRRSLWRNKRLLIGAALLLPFILVAAFGPLLPGVEPYELNMRSAKEAPFKNGFKFILGTDALGRDVLSRIISGARISLLVGFVATLGAAAIGVTLGMVAGMTGGRVEAMIMRATDVIMCYPFVVTAIIASAILSPGLRTILVVFIAFGWTGYCRVLHGVTLSIRQEAFVEASRAFGASTWWIIWKHTLPNATSTIVVMATLQLRIMILAEATLSFLGIGIQPPTPSWGVMISTGREYLTSAWWLSTLPGIALMLVVLGANLFGDGLNDYLDVRLD